MGVEKKQYDIRQLQHMKTQIKYYEEEKLELGELIGDLIFLRDVLQEVPQDWEELFTEKVLDLESVYSYKLDHQLEVLSNEDKFIVKAALEKIKNLIEEHTKYLDSIAPALS